MKIIVDNTAFHAAALRGAAIALGNFDGVHLGHLSLISRLTRKATGVGAPSVVFTFTGHPQHVISNDSNIRLLSDCESKKKLLGKTSVDAVFCKNFDAKFASMTPHEFVKTYIVDMFSASIVAVGGDHRFGKGASGDVNQLVEYGKRYGFEVLVAPYYNGLAVSSSRIRGLLSLGDVGGVPPLLGRLYSVAGTVREGFHIGRSIGVPTANMAPGRGIMTPGPGVYITSARVGASLYKSLTSIGNNPTIGILEENVTETYLFDFNDNIYNKKMELFFHKKLRGIAKFADLAALSGQIKIDMGAAKAFFNDEEELGG